jgi:hypothetical protein
MRRWFGNREDEGINTSSLELDLRRYDRAQAQESQPINDYFDESENEFFGISSAQDSLEVFKRSLRSWDQEEDDTHALGALGSTDAASAISKDEHNPEQSFDHFGHRCKLLCTHVKEWVSRFSRLSDMRARLTSEMTNEKIINRLDNTMLDNSSVDSYLGDYIKRRDVFVSMMMNMIWEFIFTRYLFGMEREQRQKLKSIEKTLTEVGPLQAARQWRAVTLTLFSKRQNYESQCDMDTEAIVQEIFTSLSEILPPPLSSQDQIESQLRNVIKEAVNLSVDMRTQKAEYVMLPPLQPEYDTNGDLKALIYFNASLMKEHTGNPSIPTNEELEAQRAVVRVVLFPLVVKKGDDEGQGDDEIVVNHAQVLVTHSRANAATSNDAARLYYGNQELDQQRQRQTLTFSEHLFHQLDEIYFTRQCEQQCSYIGKWVMRFSKFSDTSHSHLTSEINDEKVVNRLNDTILDGSNVDIYLADRVMRRDIFMSITINLLYEFVFCTYLFSLHREQRQKLKSIESLLAEVGPPESVRQWRAITLILLSEHENIKQKSDSDTETVVQAIFKTLCKILPPPPTHIEQLLGGLRRIVSDAVRLSIEMRTQKAEYIMTPILQSKDDKNGQLVATIPFNATTMYESNANLGMSNEELQAQGTVVRVVLFHPIIKKGDNDGYGDGEVVVYPGQVLTSDLKIQRDEVASSVGTE